MVFSSMPGMRSVPLVPSSFCGSGSNQRGAAKYQLFGIRPVRIEAPEAVRDLLVDLKVPDAAEIPEPVADDGPAVHEVHVVHHRDALGGRHAAGLDLLREALETVALQAVVAAAEPELAALLVAALARDHVDADPAARRLGAHAAGLVHHLLVGQVVVVALDGAVAADAVHVLAVDLDGHLRRAHPVHRHVGLLRRGGQPHLGPVHLDAGDELRRRLQRVAGRDGVENLAVEHLGPRRRLHVDQRRLARDGDRLLEGRPPTARR